MQQVPADRVITELANEIASLHRQNAILKVQVDLYQEQAATPAPIPVVTDTTVDPTGAHAAS